MRTAIISDIHGNLEALKVVIRDISETQIDKVWFLGDVAGYGPLPNECIEEIKKLPLLAIAGNHDLGVIESINIDDFNLEGQTAIKWQKRRLNSDSLEYLRRLTNKEQPLKEVTLVHGSPRDPVWEYIFTGWLAEENFKELKTHICFFGHTHLPVVYKKLGEHPVEEMLPAPDAKFYLEDDEARWLINPGSVGQPRDGNPKASYLIFDDMEFSLQYRRLDYPIKNIQAVMRRYGLPAFLSDRLAKGI